MLSEIHAMARELAAAGKRWDLVKPNGEPYLSRYVLAGTTPAKDSPDDNSIWLHHLISGDVDPYFHDHPFEGWSVILHGSYVEQRPERVAVVRAAGDMNHVRLGEYHRIHSVEPDTWSMFYATKTDSRTWGFEISGHWVQWQKAKAAGLILTSDWVRTGPDGRPFT